MVSRTSMQTDDRTCPTSHTTYVNLTSEEKSERLRCLHHEKRMCQQQMRRLHKTIADSTATDGVYLDEELHGDVLQLMNDNTKDVHCSHKEGTFQCLFWDQQRAASSLKNNKSMRWHPLFIKSTFLAPFSTPSCQCQAVTKVCATIKLFTKRFLMVPLHLSNHWCLVAVDITHHKISLHDSLANNNLATLHGHYRTIPGTRGS